MQDYVMKCEEFDINLAENVRLFASIKFGSKIYEKGHALTKEDILIFKMHDVRRIFAADYHCQRGLIIHINRFRPGMFKKFLVVGDANNPSGVDPGNGGSIFNMVHINRK